MSAASLRVFHLGQAYQQGEYVAASRRRTPEDGQQALGVAELDTQAFFESRRAAAVLKHSILSKYIVPFTAKAGFRSDGNRVMIVDGYAGRGRYEDGSPGSPALIAEAAQDPRLRGRTIECLFVEKREAEYTELCSMLTEVEKSSTTPITWSARRGNVADHLDELLDRATGVPLFLFLDPFGLGLPFEVIASVFERRPRGQGTPATEVLFRFDAGAIRRIRGVLHKSTEPSRDATLRALDTAAGGTWWRDEDDPSMPNADYVGWFAGRLLREITGRANCAGWVVPIKQREDLQPVYLLVFLTRHRAGMEKFGETISTAQADWRKEVYLDAFRAAQQDKQDSLIALDPEALWKTEEEKLAAQWREEIERNVRAILREHERFIIRPHMSEVYGDTIGVARTTHLRKVLVKLHAEGVTTSDSKGKDLLAKEVVRAPDAQP